MAYTIKNSKSLFSMEEKSVIMAAIDSFFFHLDTPYFAL